MTITVRYWSWFKDLAGTDLEAFTVPADSALGDLLECVRTRHPRFLEVRQSTLVAVGVEYQPPSHPLRDGDEVSLFPPVQGGSLPLDPLPSMNRELVLTREPIDETALVAARPRSVTAGAALVFVGIVRDRESDAPIRALDYESFEAMATHQFHRLYDELERRWPVLESVRLVHRLGPVAIGEASLWVEVTAPHRGEAFAAAQWLIDEMKKVVPIWKRPIAPAAPEQERPGTP